MTNPYLDSGGTMDSTETLVRERFESAVGALDVDVPTLVAAGRESGRRLRRRHWTQESPR